MTRIIFAIILFVMCGSLVIRELKDILFGSAPSRKRPAPPQPDPVPAMTEEEKIQFLQDCYRLKSDTPSNKALWEDQDG